MTKTCDLRDLCPEFWGDMAWPKKDKDTDKDKFMTIIVTWQLGVTLDSIAILAMFELGQPYNHVGHTANETKGEVKSRVLKSLQLEVESRRTPWLLCSIE